MAGRAAMSPRKCRAPVDPVPGGGTKLNPWAVAHIGDLPNLDERLMSALGQKRTLEFSFSLCRHDS